MLAAAVDAANKVETVQRAGWLGEPLTVTPEDGPEVFADDPHILVLEGGDHGEFCVDPEGEWKNVCAYAFGVLDP
jgi:hypothetical protein